MVWADFILSIVNLVAIEAPSAGVALAREPVEFVNTAFRIVPASNRLQVVTNHLIETLPKSFGLLTGAGHELVFNGESHVHLHSIRGHWLCVNGEQSYWSSPLPRMGTLHFTFFAATACGWEGPSAR